MTLFFAIYDCTFTWVTFFQTAESWKVVSHILFEYEYFVAGRGNAYPGMPYVQGEDTNFVFTRLSDFFDERNTIINAFSILMASVQQFNEPILHRLPSKNLFLTTL